MKTCYASILLGLCLPLTCAVGNPAAPEAKGTRAVLESTVLEGVLHDNISNAHRQGSGFNPLRLKGLPGFNPFNETAVGLNFEHIFNGAAADKERAMFTPRNDAMTLVQHDARSATLTWPAESSSWRMQSSLRFTLHPTETAIDLEFETTAMEDQFPMGWVAMMWASYIDGAKDRRIHFYGRDGDTEGWQTFGEDRGSYIEMGTVGYVDADPLPSEEGSERLNIMENPLKRFIKPFYYGLLSTSHPDNPDVPMAFVMMFDQAESIRFAMWNFYQGKDGQPDTSRPAWDWHFVIRDPEPDKRYGYRARMLLMPYSGPESVEAAYTAWLQSIKD